MIETVDTFSLKEEYTFTNSVPMLFICSGNNGFFPYYVKYIQQPNEFDCLVYEIVCQRLAKLFGLKVPDVVLVNIVPDSYNPKELKKNLTYFRAGVIAFGSRYVDDNILLSKLETVPDRHMFNTYANSLDIIKITLFDLHVDNRDRSEENFNLLIKKTRPSEFYLIDHFDCFGSARFIGKFEPTMPVNRNLTILRSSFCNELIRFIELKDILMTIEEYFYLCNPTKLNEIVDEVFSCLPTSWSLSASLDNRIKNFITNQARLDVIHEEVIEIVRYLKRK